MCDPDLAYHKRIQVVPGPGSSGLTMLTAHRMWCIFMTVALPAELCYCSGVHDEPLQADHAT
jgi:hypothetical protein